MPAVGRGKDKDQQQQQRPRKRPGRVPTSCAECRRLKLRCDRNVPCEKCVSRGCGSICPDGVLTPGKNGRMILTGTDELHDRIDHLNSRIRELESALQTLQGQVSEVPHPLLHKDPAEGLPTPSAPSRPSASASTNPHPAPTPTPGEPSPHGPNPNSMNPNPTSITDFSGTLSIAGSDQSTFFGPTARLEFLANRDTQPDVKPSQFSHELFEFACQDHKTKRDRLGKEILSHRPQFTEAFRLCDLYLKYGEVMYSPIPRSELIDDLLVKAYHVESFSDLRNPETLALLFIVLAIAIHFDPKSCTDNHEANQYYILAKACLHLSSHRENTLSYVQTLIHMTHYLHFSGADSGVPGIRFEYLGRAIQIGYKMGLHLHGIRWNLPDDLAQRRSRIFCELFLLDTWTSFYSGRPPMVSLAFMDRTTPRDNNEGVDADGNRKPGFHTWTYKYAVLLHSIMAVAFGPKPPSYPTLLDLDMKVRNFPVPIQWRPICEEESDTPPTPPEIHMTRFLVSFAKESALLNLHRTYFLSALEESPEDLSKHTFIPSVLAIYRSAWRLMRGLRFIWDKAPELISKMNLAWSQALSAAVVMCLFVTRSPGSHLTDPALSELDLLVALFEEASSTCKTANDLLIEIRSLRGHSRATAGRPHQNEGYPISASHLDKLCGKTYLVRLPEVGHTTSTRSVPELGASQQSSLQSKTHPSLYPNPSIKKDPSPSGGTSLSDLYCDPPFANSSLPVSSPHVAASSATHSLPPSNSPYRYQQAQHTSAYPQSRVARTPVPSSSSPSQLVQSPVAPPTTHIPVTSAASQALHPTIMQDLNDFAMRGTPGTSTAAHYFDFPSQGANTDTATSLQALTQQSRYPDMSGTHRSRNSVISTSVSDPATTAGRTRGHSVPSYSPRHYTPTPSQYHSHSQSPGIGVHNTQDVDYEIFQVFESSFSLDYAPQPRSPFTAASFSVMPGGASASLFQEIAEHLGFH